MVRIHNGSSNKKRRRLHINPLYAIINIFIYNNDIYNKYNNIININYIKDNNKDLYKVFKVLELYKEQQPEGSIDNFALYFFTQYPGMKADEQEMYSSLFEKIKGFEVSEDAVVPLLESMKERELAHAVALKAIDVSEGRAVFADIAGLLGDVQRVEDMAGDIQFVNSSLQDIYDNNLHKAGFRWRLESLNRMLGSLRKGNFGFVFARPEVGKTTFLASEITFMATQTDGIILWINNEEVGSVVLSRCYQASLGIPSQVLYGDIAANEKEYRRITGDRIKIVDDAGITKKKIEELCKRLNPVLIVVDQLDKVRGFNSDLRHDLQMKEVYRWARGLAKEYGPVIGICQAGGTAENKKWLDMNDVDSSHTAKQGEADFILGIGAVNDEGKEFIRYLHLSKNKLPGDEDTLPALRHGKIDVNIRPDIARYEDRMKWK